MPEWPTAEHVPAEELARRQGIQPIASVDDLARPGLFESDEEWTSSSPTSTPLGGPVPREPCRPGHRRGISDSAGAATRTPPCPPGR
ncbi:hypothetical protein NKG94_18730 [Micromonospora sp. M12]